VSTRILRHTLLGVAVLATGLVSPTPGDACSCTAAPSPKQALAQSSVVFRGVITSVQPARYWLIALRALRRCGLQWILSGRRLADCLQDEDDEEHYDAATFRVITTWKGVDRAELVVRTNPGGGNACGLKWRTGDEWVIYADEYESVLYSTVCGRSRPGGWVYQESRDLDEAVRKLT